MKKKETWRVIHTRFGYVQISSLHGKNETIENIRIACLLANKLGYSTLLLARSDDAKSPDSKNITLNIFQEYKVNQTATRSAIDNELRRASKQANHIVLEIQSEILIGDLRRGIYERISRTPNVKTLYLIRDNIIKRYEREQILSKGWML